jgi:hypothetical protein
MVGTRLRHDCSETSPRQAEADPTNFDEVSYEASIETLVAEVIRLIIS